MTLWDESYSEKQLEGWFYNKRLNNSATRHWFINEVKTWEKDLLFLDAGCGAGVTGYQLLKNNLLDNLEYVGVDFSDCMLNLAKKKVKHSNAKFLKSSLDTFTYGKKFDRILLRAVLEHNLFIDDIMQNITANLSDNGKLYIIFWNNPISGSTKVNFTPGGFYDNSFSKTYLINLLEINNCKLDQEFSVKEMSCTSHNRVIWVVRKR